jgi:hypothetical protein
LSPQAAASHQRRLPFAVLSVKNSEQLSPTHRRTAVPASTSVCAAE